MNPYQKGLATMEREAIANLRCYICFKKSDIVCNECLAEGSLACFCERHQELHKTEKSHVAYWGKLAE